MKTIPASILVLALAGVADAGVTVVTGSGSALALAVEAAADGDTLLVRAGSYDSFDLNGKSLAIVAYPGESVSLLASTPVAARVRNLLPGQTCILDGLRARALEVRDCQGAVRLARLDVFSGGGQVVNSTNVSITASQFRCDLFFAAPIPGVAGLAVTNSNVALYGTHCQGGNGGIAPDVWGRLFSGPGAAGLSVSGGAVLVSGGTLRGGNGGPGTSAPGFPCGTGGVGGPGLGSTGDVRVLDAASIGGTGGIQCGIPLADGPAFAGSVTTIPGLHRSMFAPGPVREGTSMSLSFGGQPDDRIVFVGSAGTRWILDTVLRGVVLYGTGARRQALGTVGPAGTTSASWTAPMLPAGVDARWLHVQSVFVDTNGVPTLSSPSTIVYFGASF